MNIHISEFIEVDGGAVYDRVRMACKQLASKNIEVQKINDSGRREFQVIPLMSICRYVEGEATVRLRMNDAIKPYLLELTENFTITEIQQLQKINSYYAFRIYWMLAQYRKVGHRTMEIDEFKKALLIEEKYQKFGDIRRRILDPAQIELQDTDMAFTYEAVKQGRKVIELRFELKRRPPRKIPGESAEPAQTLMPVWAQQLIDLGLRPDSVQAFEQEVQEGTLELGYIQYCIEQIELRRIEGNVTSFPGLLYKAIANRYLIKEYGEKKAIESGTRRLDAVEERKARTPPGRVPPEQVLAEVGLNPEQIQFILRKHEPKKIYQTVYHVRNQYYTAEDQRSRIWSLLR